MSTVDWKQLLQDAGSGFEVVPPGDYDVIITSAKEKVATTGKSMIAVNFKIETGPNANKVIYNQFVLTLDNPNAMSFFFQHMAALGLPREYFAQLPGDLTSALPVVAQNLVNRRARITVAIRKWQGQDRNDVKQIRQAGTGAPAAPAPPAPPAPVAAPPAQEYASPPPPAPPVAEAPAPPPAPAPVPEPAPYVPPAPTPEQAPPPPPPPPAPVPVEAPPAPAPAPAQVYPDPAPAAVVEAPVPPPAAPVPPPAPF